MGVTLTTPYKFREKIGLYGGGGSGKTTAILSMARHVELGHWWILENDFAEAYERALETDFQDIRDKVTIVRIDEDWEQFATKLSEVVGHASTSDDDWLVVDPFSTTWDYVQSWWTEMIAGKSSSEFLIDLRKTAGSQDAFEKAVNSDGRWGFINKEFFSRGYGTLRQWTGHMVLTMEAKAIGGREKDQELIDLFGHLGVMPAGQKRIHYITHTLLLMKKRGHGDWVMTTAKDRNREEMENKPVGNFALNYLSSVAGWKKKITKSAVVAEVAEGEAA